MKLFFHTLIIQAKLINSTLLNIGKLTEKNQRKKTPKVFLSSQGLRQGNT